MLHTTAQLTFENFIHYPEITIPQKCFCFISGKSGCGKSTYLKLLNGMIPSQRNTVFYDGKPISDYPILTYRKQVLLVPQNVYLISGTITDNFHFYYDNREQPRLSLQEIRNYLSICCMDMDLNTSCDTMSGGERQRVFLAIFLSFSSSVLLLDEPTAALDEKTSDLLMKNLKDYSKRKQLTVVCVCHNRQLIEQYADTVIDMERMTNESDH